MACGRNDSWHWWTAELCPDFFAIVIGLYFWNLCAASRETDLAVERESRKELEKLEKMRKISLTEPLSEKHGLHVLRNMGRKRG